MLIYLISVLHQTMSGIAKAKFYSQNVSINNNHNFTTWVLGHIVPLVVIVGIYCPTGIKMSSDQDYSVLFREVKGSQKMTERSCYHR